MTITPETIAELRRRALLEGHDAAPSTGPSHERAHVLVHGPVPAGRAHHRRRPLDDVVVHQSGSPLSKGYRFSFDI